MTTVAAPVAADAAVVLVVAVDAAWVPSAVVSAVVSVGESAVDATRRRSA